jgi:ABC-2 type transport system permease protein
MNLERIRTIIDKEWAEVFKNRMVVFTVLFMPLIFTVLPLGILIAMRSAGGSGGDTTDMPAMFAATCKGLAAGDCLQIYIINQFLLLYMVMPMTIPIAIAAYSVVGEKTTRSLEPLLATPITTVELLLGKAIAAVVPAIIATWACFAIFVLMLFPIGASSGVIRYIFGPVWISAILVVGPLMAILAVNAALMVSSRVSDPRAAEQISMVVIVPVLGAMFGQVGGLFVINSQFVWASALVLLVIDGVLVYLGAQLFQRETILTQWR